MLVMFWRPSSGCWMCGVDGLMQLPPHLEVVLIVKPAFCSHAIIQFQEELLVQPSNLLRVDPIRIREPPESAFSVVVFVDLVANGVELILGEHGRGSANCSEHQCCAVPRAVALEMI